MVHAGHWNDILGSGLKDTAPATIFDKILAKEIPSTAIYEDDLVYAFKVDYYFQLFLFTLLHSICMHVIVLIYTAMVFVHSI